MKLFSVLYLLISFTYAKDVIVYSAEIDKFNTKSDQSSYFKFLRKLEKISGGRFNIEFYPPMRAKEKYLSSKDACFFPLSLDEKSVEKNEDILSKSFGTIHLYGIRVKGDSKNYKRSFAFRSLYKEGITFENGHISYPVFTGKQLLEMLNRGRVDYIYASIPDVYLYFNGGKAEFESLYKVDKSIPVKVVRDYFSCKYTKSNKKLINKINKVL